MAAMLTFKDPAVRFSGVTKSFSGHRVLDGLGFEIPRGKITTILGLSGAGKSTVLKHILGLVSPDSGSVTVMGRDLAKAERGEVVRFRRNFGVVFQHAALFDSMPAIENVAFPLREFTDLSEGEILGRCRGLLLDVSLPEVSHAKFPGELSGGMRKRVGLARALALSPAIMLYDEPTTGLDPITTHTVNELILSTARMNADRGMTSIIISHDVRATLKISDFVAFLDSW